VSDSELMFEDGGIEMRHPGDPAMLLDVFPPPDKELSIGGAAVKPLRQGIFARYSFSLPPADINLEVTEKNASARDIKVPPPPQQLSDIFLDIDYSGGGAELRAGGNVVADHLSHGPDWMPGLKRFFPASGPLELEFRALPWKAKLAPGKTMDLSMMNTDIVGLDARLDDAYKKNIVKIVSISAVPEYRAFIK